MRVAVVGGGIAGLAAAWELRNDAEVTVFEPGKLGGCIRTTEFEGRPVDEGPDAFITRSPEALDLCRELGIESELVAPAAGRAAILWRGRLRPLPEGLVLGVPSSPLGLLRSGVLSPIGVARAALDLVLPRRPAGASPTVWELVASRLGAEVADRLVDPLVGSIHAGSTKDLGAAETVPQLAAIAGRSRSLLWGLRKLPPPPDGPPLFLAPRGGMGVMTDALVRAMSTVRFVTTRVSKIRAVSGGGVVVEPPGEQLDAAVVAAPVHEASRILGGDALGPVAALPAASVALLTVAFEDPGLPEDLNGFLVPRTTGALMTACSFASNKWPHWAKPGTALVRVSAGRFGEDEAMELDDAELTSRLLDELCEALGADLKVVASRVSRWPRSFPHYTPGHAGRVAAAEASLERAYPGVHLAGSSYRGVGIPACIASGRRAASLVRQRVAARA